ncbi:MAG: glycine betaine/L-proline ABC transporter ATP-binding protein ProV [Thermodesulfobacteriota bacterium]
MAKLTVKNLTKVFSDRPQAALAMLAEGLGKEEIFARTGLTVGVADASLTIEAGEVFVIMGLSGSGKSTLVRLFNRLIEPSCGQVLLDGEDIAAMPPQQLRQIRLTKMSMVFQSFALMPHMTAEENVAFGLELAEVERGQRRERARAVLERVGLASSASSYPGELSGGMQQRVGLARALAIDPDVLLMDEAFSALDPLIRTEMQDELLRLQQADQRTVIFISHDLDEAMRLGNRIAIMEAGRLVQVGRPADIIHAPANDYVRSFFKGVDVSHIFQASHLARPAPVTLEETTQPANALRQLEKSKQNFGVVLDADQRYQGLVSRYSLVRAKTADGGLEAALLPAGPCLHEKSSMAEMVASASEVEFSLPVLGRSGELLGLVSKNRLLKTLGKGA